MLFDFLRSFRGHCVVSARGRFPERILNRASVHSIGLASVKRTEENCISFVLSKKSLERLYSVVPEGIELTVVQKQGLIYLLSRYKKRFALILMPIVIIGVLKLFSLFVWRVDISGGNKSLQAEVIRLLKENGVKKGALRSKIDCYKVKHRLIISCDKLSWIWVDARKSVVSVKIVPRKSAPPRKDIYDPGHVVAISDGVIESMKTFRGTPLVNIGDTVEKGQILVSGVISADNDNVPLYFHHAVSEITARVWKEKTVKIPLKKEIRTPTEKKKTVFGLQFKKNNVNFSINSSILPHKYDKITKRAKVPFLPLWLTETIYTKVNISYEDTDLDSAYCNEAEIYKKQLKKSGADVIEMTMDSEIHKNFAVLKLRATCTERIDKEVPFDKSQYTK